MKIAVAGASGHTGRVVAETLLARGAQVRVILRDASTAADWQARGAEVAIADLGNGPGMTQALRDTAGAYLLVPPNFMAPDQGAHQRRIADALAAAAAESHTPHVVFLSGFAAHRADKSGPLAGLGYTERALGKVPGLRLISIRAGYFYENIAPFLGAAKSSGVLPSLFPAALPVPMVATRDVGILGADLLLDAASEGVVELGSPLTAAQTARALGKLLGKGIRIEEIATNTLAPMLKGMGFNDDLARNYVEMVEGIRSRELVFEGGHRKVEASTPPETLLQSLLSA